MATKEEVHEYFQQPEYVRRAMRLEQWRMAKAGVEGRISIFQAIEVRRSMLPEADPQAEVRRALGWGLA